MAGKRLNASSSLFGIPKTEAVTDELPPPSPIDRGTPGKSAQREYERLAAKREAETMRRHPRIGEFIVAMTDEPQSTKAWAKGARGERRVGVRLEQAVGKHGVVLHDRHIPGRTSNIDHIVVGPAGVIVVDAKAYDGKVERRMVGPLFHRQPRLYVAGRDRTNLTDGVFAQSKMIYEHLRREAPVMGALCLSGADWPTGTSPFVVHSVWVGWARALGKVARKSRTLRDDEIGDIAADLALYFPAR
ncbi:MAG: nuclease-related domain-containing protein [Acidimicrobiia bacterium]